MPNSAARRRGGLTGPLPVPGERRQTPPCRPGRPRRWSTRRAAAGLDLAGRRAVGRRRQAALQSQRLLSTVTPSRPVSRPAGAGATVETTLSDVLKADPSRAVCRKPPLNAPTTHFAKAEPRRPGGGPQDRTDAPSTPAAGNQARPPEAGSTVLTATSATADGGLRRPGGADAHPLECRERRLCDAPPLTGRRQKLRHPWINRFSPMLPRPAGMGLAYAAVRGGVRRFWPPLAALDGPPRTTPPQVPLASCEKIASGRACRKGGLRCISCPRHFRHPQRVTLGPTCHHQTSRALRICTARAGGTRSVCALHRGCRTSFPDQFRCVATTTHGHADVAVPRRWAYVSLGPGPPLPLP